MSGFPATPRLLALPFWAALAARETWVERGRPLVEARINARRGLPATRDVEALGASVSVRGLHLTIEHVVGVGWASLRELRTALLGLRAAGKMVTVELETCGNAELYLASAANRVWMRPIGELSAFGVAASLRFAGDALARFGLRFDIEAAGEFKSAGESFTRGYASPANREAVQQLVVGLEAELEAAVADGRRLPLEVVRGAIHAAPLSATEARERGLVDAVAWPDEVRGEVDALCGGELRRVSLDRWAGAVRFRRAVEEWMEGRPRVLVLHLEGPVVDGEGPPGAASIAAVPVSKALAAAAEDETVSAVVLAVQSPGGSALASDLLWRAVARLREKKPVVAVFRDVAASGGYYLAAAASEILVQPTTLTGSIGVVGGKLVLGEALARVGVHTEVVAGAPHAGMYGTDRPFSPSERQRFRERLATYYQTFVDRVATGRGRPPEDIEPSARGRVWLGADALRLGLADRVGGVAEGVARAAALADLRNPARVDLAVGPRRGRLARLLRGLLRNEAGVELPDLPPMARLLTAGGGVPLALWPFELDLN